MPNYKNWLIYSLEFKEKVRNLHLEGIRRSFDFPGKYFRLTSPRDEEPSPRHPIELIEPGASIHSDRNYT